MSHELRESESEQRFRELADHIDQFAWTCDSLGAATWYNQRWYDYTGTTFEEMCGSGWKKVHHPEHVARVEAALERAREAGQPWEDVFPLRGKDGSYRWFLSRAQPIRDGEGHVVRWFGTNTDVTALREAEQALHRSEERYALVAAGAGAAIWDWDPVNKRVDFSPRWRQLRGLADDEVSDSEREWSDGIHPDDLLRVMSAVSAHFDGRTPVFSEEYRVRHKDGRWIWIHDRGIAQRDAAGKVVRMAGSETDLTERKQAEQALRESRDELERTVERRTAELRQRARQLSRLTSELTLTEQRERRRLSRLLHDHLQQMLVSARLKLDVLEREASETHKEPVRQTIALLNAAIQASRSLTVELFPPILHDGGLVAGLQWMARWVKDKQDLTIDLRVDEAARIEREELRVLLFQSVRELLLNVVKHAGVKEASVELALHDTGHVRIVVEDRGCGFDPQTLVDQDGDVTSGFGLLGIRERLLLLGGRMEIDSRPGAGARFTLIAPIGQELVSALGQADRQKVDPSGVRGAARQVDGRAIRVLLVDDHEVIRQGLCTLLSAEGDIDVVGEASDGLSGVEQARALRPDVVLMDFSMPRMDGVEATRRISAEVPEAKVIGLSMYEQRDRQAAMTEAGAAAYVTKSDASSTLLETIRSVAQTGTGASTD